MHVCIFEARTNASHSVRVWLFGPAAYKRKLNFDRFLQINVPMYTTPFGPIVDGMVVPADPSLLMGDPGAGNNFGRYDVMFGLTESESFHLFPASTGE